MIPKRPINADVPAPEKAEQTTARPAPDPRSGEKAESAESKPPQRGGPKPAAPKLLAALVVLAAVFIVVAIVGGGGGDEDDSQRSASAPVSTAQGSESSSQSLETLGYPSFATSNTTRIGGSTPAENAAAAALAVYPSTTPAQRPDAVTIVDEADWAGAIAASVLMAPPIRTPVLFSTPDEVPEITEEALEALDPQGSEVTDGAALFAVGSVAYPGEATPVDSGDPAATAAQIATLRDRLFGGPPEHVMVAPIDYPEYAMPAAAWAARSGDPVLFTDTEKLSQPTKKALERHPEARVFVMGPSGVVSLRAIDEISKVVDEVGRVLGPGPGDSTITLAKTSWETFGWNVDDPGHGFVLVRDNSPADAAAAAALSASGKWGPLLLTKEADKLPIKVRGYLLDVKPGYTTDPTRAFYNHVWIVGDQKAISVEQQAEVNELAELEKIRDKE